MKKYHYISYSDIDPTSSIIAIIYKRLSKKLVSPYYKKGVTGKWSRFEIQTFRSVLPSTPIIKISREMTEEEVFVELL